MTDGQMNIAKKLVPWFVRNMPSAYFRNVDEETRMQHLRSISSLYGSGSDITLSLKHESAEKREYTYIRPGVKTGQLLELIKGLPSAETNLSNIKVFTSLDSTLSMSIFTYPKAGQETQRATTADYEHILDYARQIQVQYLYIQNCLHSCVYNRLVFTPMTPLILFQALSLKLPL